MSLPRRAKGTKAMNALTARLAALTNDQLADVCRGLMNDFRGEADAVFDAAFALIQERMTSAEFLALCGELEAAA
jgi:hypothetical protein